MIAVGNGEECPFCNGKHKFINQSNNDFLEHLINEHPVDLDEFLFSCKDIGV